MSDDTNRFTLKREHSSYILRSNQHSDTKSIIAKQRNPGYRPRHTSTNQKMRVALAK